MTEKDRGRTRSAAGRGQGGTGLRAALPGARQRRGWGGLAAEDGAGDDG